MKKACIFMRTLQSFKYPKNWQNNKSRSRGIVVLLGFYNIKTIMFLTILMG